MTRSEAILHFNRWADLNLLRRSEREKVLDYIYDTYADGFEIVDRKITDEEFEKWADEMDKEYAKTEKDITDSMRFDNGLSKENK